MGIRVTRTRIIVVAALAAAVGIAFLIDRLIVTDRERVERTVEDLARAVEANDAGALAPFLDAGFRLGGMDRAEFATWYTGLLRAARVKQVSLSDRKAEIDARDRDLAVATAVTTIELARPAGEWRIEWRLEFRRRAPTEWKLVNARAYWASSSIEIPLPSAAEWLRRIGETP